MDSILTDSNNNSRLFNFDVSAAKSYSPTPDPFIGVERVVSGASNILCITGDHNFTFHSTPDDALEVHSSPVNMLQYMSGVSRKARIRNDDIRGSLGVTDIREHRLA